MSLKEIAKETLTIIEDGGYKNSSGQFVDFSREQKDAIEGTRLFRPVELKEMLAVPSGRFGPPPRFDVTGETTQVAAQRLVEAEGCDNLLLLNFASAYKPGGGFLSGAKSQEEDVTRCSALYPCLLSQPDYYEANRHNKSEPYALYTDHMIYSPAVPFFRLRSTSIMDDYFTASVLTAPAPNAGAVLQRHPEASSQIQETLRRRAGMVLAVARDLGYRTLLLGAWGCGVFRNNPDFVAETFADWFQSRTFSGSFDRVVFAVYDARGGKPALRAFQARFGTHSYTE